MGDLYKVVTLKEMDKRLKKMYERGQDAASKNNLSYAMDMFRDLLKKEPGALEVRQRLRELQFQKIGGKTSTMRKVLVNLMSVPMYIFNAYLLSNAEDKPEYIIKAMDNAEKMLGLDCTSAVPLILLDRAAFDAELPEVSVQALEWAVQFYPKSVFFWDRLGQAYAGAGMGKETFAVYKKLSELQPKNLKWQEQLKDATAVAAMDEGGWTKVERGEADFHVLIRDKDAAARLEQAGHTMRTAEGLAQLIEGIKGEMVTADTAENRRRLADLYEEANNYEEAIAWYTKTMEAMGLNDPAIEQKIIALRIRSYDTRIRDLENRAGDASLTEAEQAEAKAQAVALQQEKIDRLLDNMRDRVRRLPNQVDDRFELAKMLVEKGAIDEALGHFQKLQENPKLGIQVTLHIGSCFMAKHLYDLASEQFQKVIGLLNNMTNIKKDAYYGLAKCHEKLGNTAAAGECYKAIYAADSGYRDVGQLIDELYR